MELEEIYENDVSNVDENEMPDAHENDKMVSTQCFFPLFLLFLLIVVSLNVMMKNCM